MKCEIEWIQQTCRYLNENTVTAAVLYPSSALLAIIEGVLPTRRTCWSGQIGVPTTIDTVAPLKEQYCIIRFTTVSAKVSLLRRRRILIPIFLIRFL